MEGGGQKVAAHRPGGSESAAGPRAAAVASAAGAPTDPGGNNDQLANAAARGDTGTVQRLLDSGADPNALNSFGRTPLQVMMMGNPRVAKLLLQRGADPNRPDPSTGCLPAHDAAREGFLDTLRVLHPGGARFDLPDHRGRLPIDLAKKGGHFFVVHYLQEMSG